MTHASLLRFDLEDPVHGQVPCAALVHREHTQRELPCCLMLYGGGGSRESLVSLQPSFERAWAKGELAPCIIATPDVGPWSFYLDDPARGLAWESFIIERFVPHVRTLQPRSQPTTAKPESAASLASAAAAASAAAQPTATLQSTAATGIVSSAHLTAARRPAPVQLTPVVLTTATTRGAAEAQALAAAGASHQRLGVIGMSMGGYGALKLAFAHPQLFAAVGAVSPMVEPYSEPQRVPMRNRFFYPHEVPQALLGPTRDAALYRADHPAARARANARAVLDQELAIYIDAAGRDAFNAHDGAESLHRVLWELDIPHEYHLRRDADHAGPDLAPRMCQALRWVVERLQPTAAKPLNELEQAWQAWLSDPAAPPPAAALPADSALFPRLLRAMVEPQRRAAQLQDPTSSRRYGVL